MDYHTRILKYLFQFLLPEETQGPEEQWEFQISLHCWGLSKADATCPHFSSESNNGSHHWWLYIESQSQNSLLTLEIISLVFEFFMVGFLTLMVESRGGWLRMRGEDVKDVGKFPRQHLSKDSPSRGNCTLPMDRGHRRDIIWKHLTTFLFGLEQCSLY